MCAKKSLVETVLSSTHNICFFEKKNPKYAKIAAKDRSPQVKDNVINNMAWWLKSAGALN